MISLKFLSFCHRRETNSPLWHSRCNSWSWEGSNMCIYPNGWISVISGVLFGLHLAFITLYQTSIFSCLNKSLSAVLWNSLITQSLWASCCYHDSQDLLRGNLCHHEEKRWSSPFHHQIQIVFLIWSWWHSHECLFFTEITLIVKEIIDSQLWFCPHA